VILKLSSNAKQVNASVDQAVNEFAARGFRSLGVARAEGNGAWQFLGVLPLFDPPRATPKRRSPPRARWASRSRWSPVTRSPIASETARTLGMGTDILDAASLGDPKHTETGPWPRRSKAPTATPGVPGAQVPHRGRACRNGPHCRYDR